MPLALEDGRNLAPVDDNLESSLLELQLLDFEVDEQTDPLVRFSATAYNQTSGIPPPPPISRSAPNPDPEILRAGVKTVLRELEIKASEGVSEAQHLRDREWIKDVEKSVLKEQDFVAGGFGRHLAGWEELLKDSSRASSKKVLKWLSQGVRPSFVGTEQADPKKLDQVRGLLRGAVPPGQIESYLSGEVPREIEFRNHKSFYDNLPFGRQEIRKLAENGAAYQYPAGERKPKVVNPLGVVNLPKGRLVLNGKYVNIFCKRLPFKYETLREILTFLHQNGFIATWDLKAGYFHVLIHPRYRTYFGFQADGVYYHYNAVCFGWSEACLVYTTVMQELAMEIRVRKTPLSSYLDDGFTADGNEARCLRAVVCIIKMITLLGGTFSLGKCQFEPRQDRGWLGFVVNSREQRFTVTPSKLAKVALALKELLEAPAITPRKLAAVAGKLMALSPAMIPASLYSRPLFEAIKGKISWDDVFPSPEAVQRMAKLFLDNLDKWNGRRWFPRPIVVETGSDASEFGYGGTIHIPGAPPKLVSGEPSLEEMAMSSTAREAVAFFRILKEASDFAPDRMNNSAVLIRGDNQGAVRALNSFRSPAPDVNAALQRIFELSAELNFDVVAEWRPRELMALEDHLSKLLDSSDWGLARSEFQRICKAFGVRPLVDLFASATWHQLPTFVSSTFAPGCSATNSLTLVWSDMLPDGAFAWAFPPVRYIAQTVQLIREYRANILLVVPDRRACNWWISLEQLGEHAKVEGPLSIPRTTDMCRPSKRVPVGTANPALYHLQAFKIEWP